MKPELLDFIKSLTKNDKKSLSQKALKTAEEVGELAKAVLPFENADGTLHRFSNKEKVLEESIDVILCALSVAYDLGADNDRIEEIMWRKSEFWAQLQQRERSNPFPLPFEIHVTVDINSDFDKFTEACKKIGVKDINLDLQDLDGKSVLHEVMTTSKIVGNNTDAHNEVLRIKSELENAGFNVIRQKIETVAWHPGAPSSNGGNATMPKNGYFEAHVEVLITPSSPLTYFTNAVYYYNGNISYNKRKVLPDGSKRALVTLRGYDSSKAESFKHRVMNFYNHLLKENFEVDKPLIEFSLYDTNVSHDEDWIKSA